MTDFKLIQHQFAAAIRQPQHAAGIEGIAAERMRVYQELFFNNVLNFVSSAFPVLQSLYSSEQWQQKVRAFFGLTPLASPYFLDIAESFLVWLQQQPLDPRKPFVAELAHYEWLELYLSTANRHSEPPQISRLDPRQSLQLDEMALVLSYQWPVQHISATFQPSDADGAPTLLLMYRDPQDEICFVLLNTLSAVLLQLLEQQTGQTFAELVHRLAQYFPHLKVDELTVGATDLFTDLAQKGVIRAFHQR